ncbi:Zinc finger and BTB domain-containing protein 24 [Orchesella cincta]|uniref:Zinc finger and BTB domain-containing protein 24 n=1 Tax=Orchesella cincta TaxID=48709 RepID=A0A1D2M8F4_ORCCI|nr:Zinc finger and BTB domain-containing protein 24 [Orchesella cincta]
MEIFSEKVERAPAVLGADMKSPRQLRADNSDSKGQAQPPLLLEGKTVTPTPVLLDKDAWEASDDDAAAGPIIVNVYSLSNSPVGVQQVSVSPAAKEPMRFIKIAPAPATGAERTTYCFEKFKCSVTNCGKEFKKKNRLNAHLRLHKGEVDLRCHICNKVFASSTTLKAHAIVHTTEKKFGCELCGRKFRRKVELNTHQRRHSEQKDHRCESCYRRFLRKREVIRHIVEEHHGSVERFQSHLTFNCQVCGREYSQKAAMERHIWTCHPDSVPEKLRGSIKIFNCTVCNKGFAHKGNMKRHMKTHLSDSRQSGQGRPSENFRDAVADDSSDSFQSDTPSESWETDEESVEKMYHPMSGSTAPKEYFQGENASLEESLNSLPDLMMRLDLMEVNEEGPGGLNPLLQSVVLDTLFRVADTEDLKTLRRVSKLWYRESLPRWRKDYRLILDEGRRALPRSSEMEGDPFLLTPYPFRKLRLCGWRVDLLNEGQSTFFSKFGPLIQDLVISNSVFESKRAFIDVAFGFTPNLKVLALENNNYLEDQTEKVNPVVPLPQRNLKEMTLKLVEMDRVSYRATTRGREDGSLVNSNLPRASWAEMLPLLPNLKKATLENVMAKRLRFPLHDVQSFLEAVGELRQTNGVPALESLDILNALGPASLEFPSVIAHQLSELRLPLTSLSIDCGVLTNAYVLKKILEIHSSTLRDLKVFRAPYTRPYHGTPFRVRMEKLEKLTLVGPVCSSLNFLKYMPNLKCVRTIDPELQPLSKPFVGSRQPLPPISLVGNTNFDYLEDIKIPSLVEFLDGDAFCSQFEVNRLAEVMPNLRTLRLGLDNAGLKAVLENWQNLKTLYIEPYEVVNELPPNLQTALDFPQANTSKPVDEVANLIARLSALHLKVNDSEGEAAVELVASNLENYRFN